MHEFPTEKFGLQANLEACTSAAGMLFGICWLDKPV
jgi:hypothetical protein